MIRVWNIVLLTACLISLGCAEQAKDKVTIAAAANTQYALKELAGSYTTKTGIECDLVISSSGKLTAQILEGAPYDLFLSADLKYPQLIYSEGLSKAPPEIYAYGKLVLWTADTSLEPTMDLLTDSTVRKIAVANPRTAPYGKAAIEVLNTHELLEEVGPKLIYGESIAQANQFVTTRAARLGFSSLSTVLYDSIGKRSNWLVIPDSDHEPIGQAAIIIDRNQERNEAAQKFYDYLYSEEATIILEEYGYSRDEQDKR